MEATAQKQAVAGWAVVGLLFWAATSVESLSWTQIGAFTPTYLRVLGVGTRDLPAWTAALASLSWIIGIPLAPFWGVVADRYSRKAIVVRSAVVEAALFGGWSLATDPWMALAFSCLSGFVLGNTGVMLAIQASVTPRHRLGLAVGIVGAGAPTGQALGPLTGALLIHPFGVRGMLFFDALAAVAMAILLSVLVREPPRERPVGRSALTLLREAVGEITGSPLLWRLYVALFAAMAGAWIMRPFLPIYIGRLTPGSVFGDVTTAVGVLLTAIATVQALSSPFWGRLVDRFGHVRLLTVTTLFAALALLAAGLSHDLLSLLLPMLVYSLFATALTTAVMALLASTVSEERRGAVLGQIYFPFYVAGLVGPPLGALLFHYGQPVQFAGAALLTTGPLLLLWSARRARV